MCRDASQDKEFRESINDIGRVDFPVNPDRQALPRELVVHIQRPIFFQSGVDLLKSHKTTYGLGILNTIVCTIRR